MRTKALLFCTLLSIAAANAESTDANVVEHLVNSYAHAVVVHIDGITLRVERVVYTDPKQKLPRIKVSMPENNQGRYLLFVPQGQDIDLLDTCAIAVVDGMVTLYSIPNPVVDPNNEQEAHFVRRHKFSLEDLLKRIKDMFGRKSLK